MQSNQQESANILIRSMTAEDFSVLQPDLHRVEMARGEIVSDPGQPAEKIYFPEGGVFSVLSGLGERIPTEVGLFGREGMSDLSAVLGSDRYAFRTLVQIDGHTALQIAADPFIAQWEASVPLRSLVLKYLQTMMVQIAYSLVSFAHHNMEARLARWLLMCCDRATGDDIALTHDFMSAMLGAHRSSVTVTLHVLEGIGAIRSTRGVVAIRDRGKLEDLAGDTYGAAEAEYRRLIAPFGGGSAPNASALRARDVSASEPRDAQ